MNRVAVTPPASLGADALKADIDAGLRLLGQGRSAEAEAICAKILIRAPADPDALVLMGAIQLERGSNEFAGEILGKAAALRPKDPRILSNLGRAYLNSKRFDEAIDVLECAVALAPDFIEPYGHLLDAHRMAGNVAETEHLIGVLRNLRGGAFIADVQQARLLTDLGSKAEAKRVLEDLSERHPDAGLALFMLANMDAATPQDPILGQILHAIERTPEPSPRMKFLCYAAGKIFDDLGEFDRAFGYFQRAKRQEAQTYDSVRTKALFDAIKQTFTEAFFAARKDFGVASQLPIFIVGMPRSGTTLTEQILAAHPDVCGGGELEYVTHAAHRLRSLLADGRYPQGVSALRRETAAALAFSYLRKLRRLHSEKARITDKMPHNFMLLGLMRIMFADLKVVHCLRHPFDTCLSLFMQDFVQGHAYNQTLRGLADYYCLYRDLMEHWSSLFADRILNFRYEDVVADHQIRLRELLSFAGLEWNDSVLAFAAIGRPVLTPSAWQVRKPISAGSVGRWRNYWNFLEADFSAIPQRHM